MDTRLNNYASFRETKIEYLNILCLLDILL